MLDPPASKAADAAVAGEGMDGAPVSVDGGQEFGSSAACDYRVTGDVLLPLLFFCFFFFMMMMSMAMMLVLLFSYIKKNKVGV